MTCFRKLINRSARNRRGVALFIVLAAMATLAIFVGEITYTAQINQKLAYDRLDQIKATALAKSGLRLALLRIRAYSELQRAVGAMAKSTGASAADISAVIPKDILEKIWAEPITVPFSGDIGGLPSAARDALTKFRKDSGMEGRLYIAITAQSAKMNLNSTLSAFAASPTPSPKNSRNSNNDPSTSPTPSATPAKFSSEDARKLLVDQLKETFQRKFEIDSDFRDRYRSLRMEDLADEILGWSDISYNSTRAMNSTVPFKMAPFYHVSELHFLPLMDDEIYELLSPQFTAGVNSSINVNTILEPVLAALVPQMTEEERKKFFDFRAGKSETTAAGASNTVEGENKDNSFKSADEFFKYLQERVAAFANSTEKINAYRTQLTQRGIQIITDESNFTVRIEATVHQTKRTLEAQVSVLPSTGGNPLSGLGVTDTTAQPTPTPNGPQDTLNGLNGPNKERSNLKVTQLRFL